MYALHLCYQNSLLAHYELIIDGLLTIIEDAFSSRADGFSIVHYLLLIVRLGQVHVHLEERRSTFDLSICY